MKNDIYITSYISNINIIFFLEILVDNLEYINFLNIINIIIRNNN